MSATSNEFERLHKEIDKLKEQLEQMTQKYKIERHMVEKQQAVLEELEDQDMEKRNKIYAIKEKCEKILKKGLPQKWDQTAQEILDYIGEG